MDPTGGFQIATVRGISIRVHWSWALIFTMLTWMLTGYFEAEFESWGETQRWAGALATAGAFFFSVLLHELSHALVAQGYGLKVPSITLFFFGGVSTIAAEMKSARQEFMVAAAGPAMSFLLGILFGATAILVRGDIGQVLLYLATTNVVLAVFNLLPGFPLDGGRVFRSIIWGRTGDLTKSTRIAARAGVGIAWIMITFGVVWTLAFGLNGLWYILIGLFLKQAAEATQQQQLLERSLERFVARDLMRPPPEPLPESASLQHVVDMRVLAKGERCVLLERDGRVTGLLTTTDLARIPREQWMTTSAKVAMVPAENVATVGPDSPAFEAVRLMAERDVHQVPVIEDGHLVGLLTRGDVLNHIEQRMRFGDPARR